MADHRATGEEQLQPVLAQRARKEGMDHVAETLKTLEVGPW